MPGRTRFALALVGIALGAVTWQFVTASSRDLELRNGRGRGAPGDQVEFARPTAADERAGHADRNEASRPAATDASPERREVSKPERVTPTGVVIGGIVYDGDGDPLPGAEVAVEQVSPRDSSNRGDVVRSKTDQAGRYRTTPLDASMLRLVASMSGFYSSEPVEIRIAAHERTRDVDFQIRYAVPIRGRLVDRSGAPLGLAQRPIVGLHVRGSRAGSPDGTRSWHDGLGSIDVERDRYELRPDTAPIEHVGVFVDDTLLDSAPLDPDRDDPDLVVDVGALPPGSLVGSASLSLTIVEASTRSPVTECMVWIRSERAGDPGSTAIEMTDTVDGSSGQLRLATVPGPHVVRASGRGHHAPWSRHLDLPAGETKLTVELTSADALLTGQVLNEDDRPVAFARVDLLGLDGRPQLEGPGPIRHGARCDQIGRFRFGPIASGEYLVLVDPNVGAQPSMGAPIVRRVSAIPGESAIALRLPAGVLAEFDITGPDDVAPFRFALALRDASGVAIVDDFHRGRWRVGSSPLRFALAPGDYHITVRSPGLRPITSAFSLPLHSPMKVHLERATFSVAR